MVKLIGTISRLAPKKVMVVGDLMLDTYTIGKVKRISPEAPVSVLQVSKKIIVREGQETRFLIWYRWELKWSLWGESAAIQQVKSSFRR